MKVLIEWRKHPEMVEFMMNFIPRHEEHEIHSEFLNKFGIELTEGQIGNFKHKYHVKSGTNGGCFKKGEIPHNKGKKLSPELYKRVAPTMFKKGNIPNNYRPVGTVRLNADGYYEIKISDPSRWQLMQRYVWEKANGRKLQKNECVIFLDGNKSNLEPDNLMAIKRSELARINRNHRVTNNKDLTKAGVYIEIIKERIRNGEEKKGRAEWQIR